MLLVLLDVVVGKGRQRLWTELFCQFGGAVENPDDAAVENTGIGVTMPLPCICHAQLENLGKETVSTFFSVPPPCKYQG